MTLQRTNAAAPPRRLLQSIGAVLAAFVMVFALSLGTDEVLHVLHVYPPWGLPMREPGLLLLALSYRIVFNTFGSYLTASLAPYAPMRHVWIGAAIGLVLTAAGMIAAINMDLGPIWYPIALMLSVLPCAWLGGALNQHFSPTSGYSRS
jgi:hypothetical protein